MSVHASADPDSVLSCWWSSASGTVSVSGVNGAFTVDAVATVPHGRNKTCVGTVTGTVRHTSIRIIVDVEYVHVAPALEIIWSDPSTSSTDPLVNWSVWTKQIGPFAPAYNV
jgi:hypothetical protein